MPLQQKIAIPAPEASASFDYADIQEGTGITVYNLSYTELSGNVTSGVLTRNDLYSSQMEISGNSANGQMSDTDFDVKFARPQNLKGTAYANIPHKIVPGGSAVTGYLIVRLRKWDGTTETEIVQASSKVLSASGGGAAQMIVQNVPLVIPLTHFKKDESLRCTVEAWGTAASGTYGYGIDPRARTESWMRLTGQDAFTSQSTLSVPFVLKT